jgi:TyrR family helix-turn-helix protein
MFELAKKGTLFLDEIGDISFSLQAKMLRVLQEHEIMRVGGIKSIAVDARIIAATNKDLSDMVRQGSFREDLYYRLNVVSIEIPPLRERKEDIPLLTLHFLEKINRKYSFSKRISPEVIDGFLMYPWPGNIRELENVTERMLVMTEEDEIQINHVPSYIRNAVVPADDQPLLLDHMPLKKAMERMERQVIELALKKHGSTRKVARALKVNQSTIVRKIKKYQLSALCDDLDELTNPFEDMAVRI